MDKRMGVAQKAVIFNKERKLLAIRRSATDPKTEVVLSFEHDKFEWLTKEEFLQREPPEKLRHIILNIYSWKTI